MRNVKKIAIEIKVHDIMTDIDEEEEPPEKLARGGKTGLWEKSVSQAHSWQK